LNNNVSPSSIFGGEDEEWGSNIRHEMRLDQVPEVVGEVAPYEDNAADEEDRGDVDIEIDVKVSVYRGGQY
jgi:hypothetical protein